MIYYKFFFFFCSKNLFGKNVVVGTNNLKKGGDSFKIKRVIVHPQFNIMKLKNDLALIEIEGILEFSSNVKPISLPTYDIREADTSVVASGWGRLKVNFEYFNIIIIFFFWT